MSKRFTDTDKWKDEWFTDLEPAMKCLWIYICDSCDCAGVWKVNFKQASFNIGAILDKQSALNAFQKRIRVISDDKWFVEKFIKFQYPKGLSDKCSAHLGVIKSLKYNNIETNSYLTLVEDLPNSKPTVQDKDKDKDKDKDYSLAEKSAEKNLPKKQPQDFRNSKETVDSISDLARNVLVAMNSILFKDFKPTTANMKLINARIKEGYTLEDFTSVFKHKLTTWGNDDKMRQYLVPATLLCGKFDGYVQAANASKTPVEDPLEAYLLSKVPDLFQNSETA